MTELTEIQHMILKVLEKRPGGLTLDEICVEIERQYGIEVELDEELQEVGFDDEDWEFEDEF